MSKQRPLFYLATAFVSVVLALSLCSGRAGAQDFDSSGIVDGSDVSLFQPHLGQGSGQPGFDPRFDLNGDGRIDFTDFVLVARNFGRTASEISLMPPSILGPNANAIPALDLDGSGNSTDDGIRTGTVSGSGTAFTVQVFAKNFSGSSIGADVIFDIDLSKVKITGSTPASGFLQLARTDSTVFFATLTAVPLTGDGYFGSVEFTTQSDVTSVPFEIRLRSMQVGNEDFSSDFLNVSGVEIAINSISGTRISVDKASINFGNVDVDQIDRDTLRVSNISATDLLVIHEITTAGPVFDLPAIGVTSAMVLGALQDTSIVVRFGPLAAVSYADTVRISSDDPTLPLVKVPLSGTGTRLPDIEVSPDSLAFSLPPNDSTTQTMTVANTGQDSLIFQLATNFLAGQAAGSEGGDNGFLALEKGEPDPRPGAPVISGSGGPDAFGYRWTDSDEAGGPTFGWVEISGVGTQVPISGDDSNAGPFPIGFSFPFYSANFDSFRACSNGFVSFTSNSRQYTNQPLPSTGAPFNMLALFWDDLVVGTNARVYFHNDGGRLIVQYQHVTDFSSRTADLTFQAILHPNGQIVYQYLSMHPGSGTLASSTVGIQNAGGTVGLQVAFNNTYVHDGLAVRIAPEGTWLSASPTSGRLGPGGSAGISVTANSGGFSSGAYDAGLTITSNDPDESPLNVPVHMIVTGPEIVLAPDSLAFSLAPDDSAAQVLAIGNIGADTLRFQIETEFSAQQAGAGLANPTRDRSGDVVRTELSPDEAGEGSGWPSAGPPVDAEAVSLPFRDGFEDGDFNGWVRDGSVGSAEVTSATAAVGNHSFHYNGGNGTHSTGIHMGFESGAQPEYVSFWVRSGSTSSHDAYFSLSGASNAPGANIIFFFARGNGRFYVNENVGGNESFIYEANRWYRVEFRNIDWTDKDFDYYVDGELIQADISFRNASTANAIGTLWLYNFSASDGWWDEVQIGAPGWLAVSPTSGAVGVGSSLNVSVEANTVDFAPGTYDARLIVTSNDPSDSRLEVPAHLSVTGPEIAVAPDSLGFELQQGTSGTRVLTVSNSGSARLSFDIWGASALQQSARGEALPNTFLSLEKGEPDPRPGSPVISGSGGPDRFGYRWVDSDETGGPTFSWVDISDEGTLVFSSGDDRNAGPFPIGFPFRFYENEFEQFRVCTNGFISFTSGSTQFTNQPLPNSGAPDNLLAAFWDDLILRSGSRIYYHNDGNRLIVQYKDVGRLGSSASTFDFEVFLYPDGRIIYQYRSMAGMINSSTIGIQNADGTVGLQVAFNNTYVRDSLAVRISSVPPWLSASPTSGTVDPGSSMNVSITADAEGMPVATHEAELTITHNAPTVPPVLVPVGLTVTGAADISVFPIEVSFSQVIVGDTASTAITVSNLGGDPLAVSSVATRQSGVFIPDSTAFNVTSGDSVRFLLRYAPSEVGTQDDTLSITSDDPDESLVQVPLRGEGVSPPQIAVDPAQFDLELNAGDTAERVLTVSNIGGSGAGDLIVQIGDRRIEPLGAGSASYRRGEPLSKPTDRSAHGPSLSQRYADGTVYGTDGPNRPSRKPVALQQDPPPPPPGPGPGPAPPPVGIPFVGPLNGPLSVAFDPAGNLFVGVADGTILKVLPDASLIPFVSGVGSPMGLAFDSDGNLFAADNSSGTVFRITSEAAIEPFASGLGFPVGLAFSNEGDLFVAEETGEIFRITPDGGVVSFVTGLPEAFGIAFDASGNLLVTTSGAGEILQIDPAGNVRTLVAPGAFLEGIAVDVNGKIYVGNGFAGTIEVYNPDGTLDSVLSDQVAGFPISMAFGFVPDGVGNTGLFVGNGSFIPTPFANHIVQFNVGVPGLPLPPTGVPWLSESPSAFTLPADRDTAVVVTIDTRGLTAGLHQASIGLASNDLDGRMEVPVNLTVIGAPGISVTPDSLVFEALFVGESAVLGLQIRNVGSDTLDVSEIAATPSDFAVSPTAARLPPLSSQHIAVTFTPAAAGLREGAVSISSNDPNDPVVAVGAVGIGRVAPDINLNTPALNVVLPPGGRTTGSLILSNRGVEGASDLNFTAEIGYGSSGLDGAGGMLSAAAPQTPPQAKVFSASSYVPDEILVKFRPRTQDAYVREVNRMLGARSLRIFRRINVHHLKIESGAGVDRTLAAYRNNSAVVYAEPNYIVSIEDIPDDPLFPNLWGLHNTGQEGGVEDADIDAPDAWDRADGAGVVVGIIDTGVDWNHPDLAANIWSNSGEVPDDGLDNDGNGFVDDVRGWDFRNDDNDPFDDNGHGTHVAGTVAAIGNNGIGVIGVAFHAQVMPLKFLGSSGSGSTADAIAAVNYAVNMGAHITNNSWGGGGFSQALKDAIVAADEAGVLFVAAAGNSSRDNDMTPHFPSNYQVPNIISVASTDRRDALSFFSNFGANSVHLAGPGSDILSTLPGSAYGVYSGTSMATPHVAGVAALLYGLSLEFPGAPPSPGVHLNVKSRLLASADRLEALVGKVATAGRLNAFNSLISKWLSLGVLQGAVPTGSSVSIPVRFDAAGLEAGQHAARVVFRSNDPDEGVFTLPVTMQVEPTSDISGRLHYYDDPSLGVEGVEATLSPVGANAVSDADGHYVFSEVLPGAYTIAFSKFGGTLNAIQGSDAVTILLKTAFLLPEELSADQRLAGDINGDGLLDNSDALGILRYLAFFDAGIGQTGGWRFRPGQISVTSGGAVQDVEAFLMGDVLPSWGDEPPLAKRAGGLPVGVDASEAEWKGELLRLPIRVQDREPVGSLLLSLDYDPALFHYEAARLTDIGRDYLLVDNGEQEGRIHIALAGAPQAAVEGPVFELVLRTEEGSSTPVDQAELTLTRLVVNDIVFPLGAGSPLTIRRVPEYFELTQNYPNPFNPQTQIRFGLPEMTQARLAIYNVLGQEVRVLIDGELEAGFYTVPWDGLTARGAPASSGVYIYHLRTASGFVDTRRMLLLK